MCGIVGLFLKDQVLQPMLGEMMSRMLGTLSDRGPDSAGFAIYSEEVEGRTKLTIRAREGFDFGAFVRGLSEPDGCPIDLTSRGTHAVLSVPVEAAKRIRDRIATTQDASVVGVGRRMELYKEIGLPAHVSRRFGLNTMTGTHGIGHTRMATESAVTTAGAHPFSTGDDQCLVHNGSLSNHNAVRRTLVREGLKFDTDNDSEVAAGYLTSRMQQGATLGDALSECLNDLDGFYTFVVGTEHGFGVLRDRIACKPAIMAETDRYVAFGTEYRALVDLPGIAVGKVWEPEPGTVYFWDRCS